MIQTFHYRVPAEGDPLLLAQALRTRLGRLVVEYSKLRGVTIDVYDDHLLLKLRVAGHNRWQISGDTRQILTAMLRRAGGDWRHTELLLVETEPTARNLTQAQGRQERVAKPKGTSRSNRAWDHVPWQGDAVG